MKKVFFFLFLLLGLILSVQAQQLYYIQLGPEINFTQATDSSGRQRTVKSMALNATLNQRLTDYLSLGLGYSFGRAWQHNHWANLHKYLLLATVISQRVSFSLVYEYIYTQLPRLKASGSGLGVKINYAPFNKNQRINFWASANRKNQALGIVYNF